jgi:hypothetical protein
VEQRHRAKKLMWIVKLALNRPYTFIVLALLVLTLSPVVILRTPTDIFSEYRHSGRFSGVDLYKPQPRTTGRVVDDT